MQKYERPPIIERALSVIADIEEETFHRRSEAWKDIIRTQFPELEDVTVWDIQVQEKDGMPFLDPDQKMSIRHRFWKPKAENGRDGTQVWTDRIVFNLIGRVGKPRHFSELESMASEWIPQWMSHFDVKHVRGINLEYVNVITAKTIPKFTTHDTLHVGKVLNHFAKSSGSVGQLIPPYQFKINRELSSNPPLILLAKLTSLDKEMGLSLNFRASTDQKGRQIGLDQLKNDLTLAHDAIIREFEASFTPEALQSFAPYDPDEKNQSK